MDLAGNEFDEVQIPILPKVEIDLFAILLDQLTEGEASPASVFSL